MHNDEFHVDAGLVGALIASQFPQWSHLAIEPVSSAGTDNALFRLGPNMSVRLPRIGWSVGHVEREHRWLPFLAPQLPIAIPAPIALGVPEHGYPWKWSVLEWIEGTNPTPSSPLDWQKFAVELAGFINTLHAIDTTNAPLSWRGEPLVDRNERVQASLAEVADLIDVDAERSMWVSAIDASPWTRPAVWVHGDITRGNMLCDRGELAAVIDFAPGIGDPACDLTPAWNLLPPASRCTFRSELQVADATWNRGRGWALSVALIELPYYRDRSQGIVDHALYVLSQVLSDDA